MATLRARCTCRVQVLLALHSNFQVSGQKLSSSSGYALWSFSIISFCAHSVFQSHIAVIRSFYELLCVLGAATFANMYKATFKGTRKDGYLFSISASCARDLFTAQLSTSRNEVLVVPELAKFDFDMLNTIIACDVKPCLDSMQPPMEVSSVVISAIVGHFSTGPSTDIRYVAVDDSSRSTGESWVNASSFSLIEPVHRYLYHVPRAAACVLMDADALVGQR